ncbi:MAG: transglutaminase domain-containing protein [Anaerolineales bacterium]|nr:transglutaminase domain-containing protein [Anaerolineales bacterium]
MNRFFSLRSLLSLGLLLVAAAALVSGIKTGVAGVEDAAFFPVAAFATVSAYLLGFGRTSARRASIVIFWLGAFVILFEATRLREVFWQTVFQIPRLEFDFLMTWVNKQPFHTLFFQIQLDESLNRIETFIRGLLSTDEEPSLILRELLWDIPLLVFCAWAGWWSSRRNLILTALGPSLALHGLLLNYTQKPTFTLQIAAFAFIFLLGIHQTWSIPARKSEAEEKVRRETYATLFVLSFLLTMAAGWTPVFSVSEAARRIAAQQNVNETLGLEREIAQSYTVASSGLPRQHLIDSPPQDLLAVVFTADTGERPFLDFDEEGVPSVPQHYWRWLTYDQYNGHGWSTSTVTSDSYLADETLFEFNGEGYTVIHQTIRKASPDDGHLYWTGALVRVSQPFESTWRVKPTKKDPLLHMDMLGSLAEAQQYSADSLVPQLNETQLREAPLTYPQEITEKYLALPDTVSKRVLNLAAELTTSQQNAYDKAKAIEAYLRTYPYTLDVPAFPPDKEIADYFLFELKTGYCDYYASSMVVLARAAGLPARMVIGYSSGDYDRTTEEYIVREGNAHSWVEVYFPTIGWVEFEPTASQPAIERPLDSAGSAALPPTAPIKNREGISHKKQGYFVEKNPFLPLIEILLIFIIACWWTLRKQGLYFSYASIASIYKWVYHHGYRIHQDAPSNETPSLFAEKLKIKLGLNRRFLRPAAGELDQLTSLYLKETYSPHPVTKSERQQAIKIWRKLFWRMLYARTIR